MPAALLDEWGYIGIMEKKMETTGTIWGLYRDYRVYVRVILEFLLHGLLALVFEYAGLRVVLQGVLVVLLHRCWFRV